jgi:outer membrane receptor for ferrienterochelin and colicin
MSGWGKKTVLAAASALALAQGVQAQQAQPAETTPASQPAAKEAVKRFEPSFFARYAPVTAQDMVRQLPGFSIDNGDSLRGFGATAGNVLIDGQRPSSKNSISDELGRISARDVARIELIGAAAAGDIDVRGYTELANVVLKPATGTQVSTTWRADTVYAADRISLRAGGVRQWKTHDLTVRLNVQPTMQGVGEDTFIESRNAAGALTSTRDESEQTNLGELLINGTLNWTPTPRDLVNLTGRLMPRTYRNDTNSLKFDPAGALLQYDTDDYTEKDILHAELGGDWEHKFSSANTLKLILVNRAVTWRPQELFRSYSPAGAELGAQRINTELKTGEHVVRGVWTLKPADTHTVEMGLEGAFNYLDQHRAIDDSTLGGAFTPRVLPIATTRVEEVRGEVSINDTWRIDPKLTLELGFTYEASTITQTGDATQEREFSYPKPRAVASWVPTKEDQIRLSFERTVAQLSFSEFASNVVPLQGTQTLGNSDLRPAQTWETSLQWKRAIGQRGSVSVTGFYHAIEDTQDFIPNRPALLQTNPECVLNPNDRRCVFTAAGNIGDGKRYGVEINATYPLDDFGIKGGILKFTGDVGDSEVTDPITGQKRRINGEQVYGWNIDFRQDLPDMKLSWGGDYSDGGESESYRLNEEQRRSSGPGDLDLFIETTAVEGMTIRLSAENLGDQPDYFDRRFFDQNRFPGGVFSGSEHRETTGGPAVFFTVSGAF